MGFVHRHPRQRRFLQALAPQGGTTPGMPRLRPHTGPTQGRSLLRLFDLIPTPPPGALSFAAIACAQRTGLPLHFSSHSLYRRTRPRSQHFRLALPPSRLPAGSKTDASFEVLVSPEHHALALTGSRLGELAPTLTTEFQDNAVRRFAWRRKMDDLTYTLRQRSIWEAKSHAAQVPVAAQPRHAVTTRLIQDARGYFCSKSSRNSDSGFTADTCS